MSERIVKNVGSGLIAQAWTVLLGLFALPILVRGLGAERYGLLALSLALIGFAAVADLGVGRAASKFIAEDFERDEIFRTQKFVSTALTVSTTMGVLGTAVLLLLAPLLALHVFEIRPETQHIAKIAFALTAAGLLPVLLRILFDGVLAGHHRIAFLSFTNMIANTLKAGLSIVAILTGYSVLTIILVNVVVCCLQAGVLGWYTHYYFRGRVGIRFGWDTRIAHQLLQLGVISSVSWIMANVIFLYADRFIIGVFLPLSLVGYYTTAFDITSKQWYISSSISQAFFPVFSGKSVSSVPELERGYIHATKALAVLVTGVAILLAVLGRELLAYWISPEFALHSSVPLMILAIGILFSCYVTVPYTTIIAGSARPGACVAIFAVAIVLHIAASLWWLRIWGIAGVGLAFTAAYCFVFLASIWWVSRNVVRIPVWSVLRECFIVPWFLGAVCGLACWFLLRPRVHNLLSVGAAFAISYLIYFGLCVLTVYSPHERHRGWAIGRSLLGVDSSKSLAVMAESR
jgi:O-antigen/teichoic acid export membrane protein